MDTGSVVVTLRTHADGRFQTDLPPGRYELQTIALDGPDVTGPPMLIRVSAGHITETVVLVDTGIR